MVYRGQVHNGVVVVNGVHELKEGQPVSVRPVREKPFRFSGRRKCVPSFYDRYKDLIGPIEGLPSDLSRQIDHYLYGTPKR